MVRATVEVRVHSGGACKGVQMNAPIGSYPVRWTKHSTNSSSLPFTSVNAFVANTFVANVSVGMLCFNQHREPLEQEER